MKERATAVKLIAAAMVLALPGCGTQGPKAEEAAPIASPDPALRPGPVYLPPEFLAWREGFRARAIGRGIRPEVFDMAFAGVGVNADVLERDRYQPEFRRQIWDYLDRAVSDTRIANGRAKWAEYGALLRAIEARYGVDARVLLAIWGLESNYGEQMGDHGVIESLATLAYEGRRREFAEAQLLTALDILQAGDIPADRMLGSWAGAMGHTQFIPTSFAAYAEDWTGDGRRDVWSADPADALASTANYLAAFGWKRGVPWGMEVRLPDGFDPALADGETWRDNSEWAAAGVAPVTGGALPALGRTAILAPAGLRGPVFAISENVRVIRRYNNATSYALAVGHLGDRILGAEPFAKPWPRGEEALTVSETIELQERLTALGHDTLGADGLVGPRTVAAIRDYQRAAGLPVDGFPTRRLLASLKRAPGG
ncbi:MAG TPA: lytic murein transglycosylase [Paracoccaceae bacterium]|nr:lytic murein transglycosylase [Paracoccaceae bacterium]